MAVDNLGSCQDVLLSGTALARWYQWGQTFAREYQVPLGELDWLVLAVTDLDRLALRLGTVGDRPAIHSRFDLPTLTQCWEQRCRDRTPVQYLAGFTPWRTLNLRVTPAVLIPRPETELLVDIVYQHLQQTVLLQSPPAPITVADLGTGSGAIALALAEILPTAQIYGVDCSTAALAIARQNGEGSPNPVQFRQGSWLSPLADLRGKLTVLVSNPPYIPSETVTALEPEVRHHEPHLALDGGPDGLDDIRHLIQQAPTYLRPGGLWAVEPMAGQGTAIASLLMATPHYTNIQMHRDFAGRDRFVTATRIP